MMISIITPCYNAEVFLPLTINSVLNQTFQDWELLVVDDCSTDCSAKIVNEYVKKDRRIKYYKTSYPSGSPALPRNIGIENAKGDYISFLDADDLWLPDKLEKQKKILEQNKYDFVYSFYEKIDDNGKRCNRVIKTRGKTRYKDILKSNSIPCLTAFLKKEIIGSTRFKPIPQEDFCFWLDILKKGYIAYNIGEVTALYREAPMSRSSNKIKMFKGYWNVIRNHQRVAFISACYYMVVYSILGILKYLK